jgi:hypothetical protein
LKQKVEQTCLPAGRKFKSAEVGNSFGRKILLRGRRRETSLVRGLYCKSPLRVNGKLERRWFFRRGSIFSTQQFVASKNQCGLLYA